MASRGRFLFVASMDVDADKEALFNEVYDREHIPNLLKVPGVLSARRYAGEPLTMMIGGARRTMDTGDAPKYTAVYELESPQVLLSDAWAKAVEAGRWPNEVRPFTRNRRHRLLRLLD